MVHGSLLLQCSHCLIAKHMLSETHAQYVPQKSLGFADINRLLDKNVVEQCTITYVTTFLIFGKDADVEYHIL